jgi:membrane-associated phospholipid phosphatase
MAGHAYSATAVPSGRLARTARSTGAGAPLALAVLCAIAILVVWAFAAFVPQTHAKDAVLLFHFTQLSTYRLDQPGELLLKGLAPLPFVIWGLALVAIALARGRARTGLAVVAIMGLAPLTSETLKPLLAHPHLRIDTVLIGPASLPSGHSTAALALALSAALVTPARLRPLVGAIGAVFAAVIGCYLLILQWHMPSDVLAGFLVATMWTALAVAALRAAERRWPTHKSI